MQKIGTFVKDALVRSDDLLKLVTARLKRIDGSNIGNMVLLLPCVSVLHHTQPKSILRNVTASLIDQEHASNLFTLPVTRLSTNFASEEGKGQQLQVLCVPLWNRVHGIYSRHPDQ